MTAAIADEAMTERISQKDGRLIVPDNPVVPFIEGDGIGPDIWRAAKHVLDQAVAKAYSGRRGISWREVLAGEKAFTKTKNWLPQETLDEFKEYRVGLKGPLTTPVGGGIRSLNVALRQILDLYVCLRPIRHFPGVPFPVRHPEKVNMVVFRENTEDVYSGKELESGSAGAKKLLGFLRSNTAGTFARIRASASSRFRNRGPSVWCAPPCAMRWRTAAPA